MKYIFVFTVCVIFSRVSGQTISDSSFKKGFQFTVQHEENSNAFIRFDESVLDLNYKAHVEKGYTLLSSSNGVHQFSVKTQQFIDTVESEGRKTVYNSDHLSPPSSRFENLLDSLLKTSVSLEINNEGIVSTQPRQSDVLAELMGLHSGVDRDSIRFILLPGITLDSAVEEGKRWSAEEVGPSSRKVITTYRLVSKTAFYHTVEYQRTITSDNENSNENGVMVIDTVSGFLEELNSKTISNSKVEFNGKPCLVEKWSDKIQRFTIFND